MLLIWYNLQDGHVHTRQFDTHMEDLNNDGSDALHYFLVNVLVINQ